MTPIGLAGRRGSPSAAPSLARETANSGVSAISGMAARSWNSRTANAMPAVAQRQLALLLEHLQAQRPSTTATAPGRRTALPARPGRAPRRWPASTQRGDGDLRPAQAEDGRAHGPQALGAQLQADQKQQQHHAELGKCRIELTS